MVDTRHKSSKEQEARSNSSKETIPVASSVLSVCRRSSNIQTRNFIILQLVSSSLPEKGAVRSRKCLTRLKNPGYSIRDVLYAAKTTIMIRCFYATRA